MKTANEKRLKWNEHMRRYREKNREHDRQWRNEYQKRYMSDPKHPERKKKQAKLSKVWVNTHRDYVNECALERYNNPLYHDRIVEQHKRAEKKYYSTHMELVKKRARARYLRIKAEKNKKNA